VRQTIQPTPRTIQQALEGICASPMFIHSERMSRFLRFVVERMLAGAPQDIREFTIGMAVFDRDPGYDPKIDIIVRVEARRLRKKLEAYYEGPGAGELLRIEVPGPGYVPSFVTMAGPPRKLAGQMNSMDASRQVALTTL
jgi:hypothetical protein